MISNEEKILASMGYLVPLQLFAKFFALKLNMYNGFVKNEIRKGIKLWLILIIINIPVLILRIFNIQFGNTGVALSIAILGFLILCFVSSLVLLGIITVNVIKIFRK